MFGIFYVAPGLVALNVGFGVAREVVGPQAALGLAGLTLAALGSLAAMIIAQLRPPEDGPGASLMIWANLIVLVLGDALFYSGDTQETVVLLFGLSTALLTTIGLLIISGRKLRG